MAAALAESPHASGNNNTRSATSKPSPSLLLQQRCEAQFVSAKTDSDSSRISPIIIPAPAAPLSPSFEQRTGHQNAASPHLGRLQISSSYIYFPGNYFFEITQSKYI
jgi:hypothetical protein